MRILTLKKGIKTGILEPLFYLLSIVILVLLLLPIVSIKFDLWWLDNLQNLQMQWSLAAVSLLFINWLYVKKIRLLLSGLYLSMISYNVMPLYISFPIADTAISEHKVNGSEPLLATPQILTRQRLTIAQLNLHYHNPNLKKLLPVLGDKHFDLLVLQEASDTEYKQINALSQYYPYSFGITKRQATPAGMAIFSRWPIIEQKIHQLGYKSGQILEVIIQAPDSGLPIQVFTLHPGAPRNKILWQLRNQTLDAVSQLVANSPFEHKIVIGDFNSSPWSSAFKSLQKRSQLKNSARGFGYIPSWSYSSNPLLSLLSSAYIDHNLISRPFSVINKVHHTIKGSDHRLIFTELAI